MTIMVPKKQMSADEIDSAVRNLTAAVLKSNAILFKAQQEAITLLDQAKMAFYEPETPAPK